MAAEVLRFDDWKEAIRAQVPAEKRAAYSEAITKFHYWLRQNAKPITLETFQEHVAWKQSYMPADRFAIRREALQWYYKEALKRSTTANTAVREKKAERGREREDAQNSAVDVCRRIAQALVSTCSAPAKGRGRSCRSLVSPRVVLPSRLFGRVVLRVRRPGPSCAGRVA